MKREEGPNRLRAALTVSSIVVMLALTGACGVKSAPYPAMATLPEKVQGLSQSLTDQGELILNWRPPANNLVKRPLTDLGGFEIRMADNTISDAYCVGCPHRFETVDRLPAASPPPGLDLAPGPYSWRYQLTEGHVYVFRVYSVAPGGGIHPQSYAETTVWAISAPGPLPGFSAGLGDRSVELSWRRPAQGFRAEIEKRGPGGDWAPLADLDQNSGRYSDTAVEYEKTYLYRARLAKIKEQTSAPGPWSPEITVRVVDLTPPNPPGHLDASLAAGGVQLRWESLAFDPDLAGYRLYRQGEGESGYTRVGPALLTTNSFFDPVTDWNGQVRRYQVTAVDKSPRANESQPSPVADVYLDPPHNPVPRPQ